MDDYTEYLEIARRLAGAKDRAARAGKQRDAQFQSTLTAARAEMEAAHARTQRLRQEAQRQLALARAALTRAAQRVQLPVAIAAAAVREAGEAEVTSSVRALQAAVERLVRACDAPRPVARSRTVWVVVGVLVAMVAAVVIVIAVT